MLFYIRIEFYKKPLNSRFVAKCKQGYDLELEPGCLLSVLSGYYLSKSYEI